MLFVFFCIVNTEKRKSTTFSMLAMQEKNNSALWNWSLLVRACTPHKWLLRKISVEKKLEFGKISVRRETGFTDKIRAEFVSIFDKKSEEIKSKNQLFFAGNLSVPDDFFVRSKSYFDSRILFRT